MNENAIWILNFNYDEIFDLTYPYFKNYATRINADLNIINERLFPAWHITYEKVQVYDKGKQYKWNLVFDTDALLHPNLPNFIERVDPYSIGVHDTYGAFVKFKSSDYFMKDQRNIAICGLFAMASHYCHDLFEPLPLSQEYYKHQITMDPEERERQVPPERFITEYWLSNNLAKYSLKYQGVLNQQENYMLYHPYGWRDSRDIFHSYTNKEKIQNIKNKIETWKDLI